MGPFIPSNGYYNLNHINIIRREKFVAKIEKLEHVYLFQLKSSPHNNYKDINESDTGCKNNNHPLVKSKKVLL